MQPDPRLPEFLRAHGLAGPGDRVRWTPLTGGVASDIWRVDVNDSSLCVKCALPKLRVARDWYAPTSRNGYEWAWMKFAFGHLPESVPRPLAHDPGIGAFAMSFLDGATHPVWKSELLAGRADPDFARGVGARLGRLHAASAGDPAVRGAFPTDDIFQSIRLEPYLIAAAQAHPDLGTVLRDMAADTLGTHKALVHGDISPKNILVGPSAPVFLDAECAWYGDPAFDLAFCLNHFLLKCLPRPDRRDAFLRCFEAFTDGYLEKADWEPAADLEERAARLLPALLLARIDGKSPVEYVTETSQKDLVRQVARPLISRPCRHLTEIAVAWRGALAQKA